MTSNCPHCGTDIKELEAAEAFVSFFGQGLGASIRGDLNWECPECGNLNHSEVGVITTNEA